MRLQVWVLVSLLVAGCARFEPRVSVETSETGPARAAPRSPAKVQDPGAAARPDHTVVRGDTLYGIAFRNKLDVRDLAAWNNIRAPHTIYPGQALRLSPPSRTTRITAPGKPAEPVTPPPRQVEVAPVPMQVATVPEVPASDSGNTQTFAIVDDVAPTAVAMPDAPKPVASTPASTPAATTSPAAAIGLPPGPPQPATASLIEPAPVQVQVPTTIPIAETIDTSPLPVIEPNAPFRSRDGVRWRWPAAGQIIGRFVEGDPTQQGIDIGGVLGQRVLAAADGEVVYSGNGLIGYGELVIIQHSPGFLSAYGHNQKRLVVEGSRVKAGQPIAEMGRRGGIDMLHFEVRKNGKPVDPLGYLPSR